MGLSVVYLSMSTELHTQEARNKICERVWLDLDTRDRVLMQRFVLLSEADNIVYTDEPTLNRLVAELKQLILDRCGSAMYLDIFWLDKMKDSEDLYRKKLQTEV